MVVLGYLGDILDEIVVVVFMAKRRCPLRALSIKFVNEFVDHVVGNQLRELNFKFPTGVIRSAPNPDVSPFARVVWRVLGGIFKVLTKPRFHHIELGFAVRNAKHILGNGMLKIGREVFDHDRAVRQWARD